MKNIKDKYTDEMFEGILKLKNVDDCYKFFSDLCTPREIKSMAQRFTVAKMLSEKRVYSDIVNETGASTATISRDIEFLRTRFNAPIEYDAFENGYYYKKDFDFKF